MQKRGVLRNAYYLQDVVPSVQLIYVARLYGVLPCSAYPNFADFDLHISAGVGFRQ